MARRPNNPIQAPPASPPRLGLLRSITAQDVADQQVGFNFYPEGCGQSGVGDPAPCNTDHDKTIPDNPAVVDVYPAYAWAGDKCSAFGFSERDWQGRARRQLAATISYQVALELWRGEESDHSAASPAEDAYVNPYLASTDSDEVTTGATSVTDGIARLEQALGDCAKGQRGTIHLPYQVATYAATLGVIRREGNLLVTALDTLVIADAGYDGSGPGRIAPEEGSVWGYATGIPIVQLAPEHMFPEQLGDALDRRTNTVEYRIERQFAVGWDGCCHFAAEFNLGWPATGGAS